MEYVSAVEARLAVYRHDLWQVEQINPLRLALGEGRSFTARLLSRFGH
jgi:hypothetical protein